MNQSLHRPARLLSAAVVLVGALLIPAASSGAVSPSASEGRFAASGKAAENGPAIAGLQQLGGRGAGPLAALDQSTTAPPLNPKPECPIELMTKCRFVPAAYELNDPADKSNYGNYDLANRPTNGLAINSVVVHDTEGSLADVLEHFQDPSSYVSAHYVINTDGTVYQMVQNKNVAWHAGNWYINQHSIGIEHVGHAAQGGTEYTAAMYQSSAALVRYLSKKYNFPLDRQHILGHDSYHGPTTAFVAGMHYDPGPYWNWQYYLAILGAPVVPTAGPNSPLLTMSPIWAINRPVVTDCSSGPCQNLPEQSANFVYLRTSPSDSAPLLSDPALHPDGAPGTTRIEDWSAKASYGQQFAVAERQGDWTAIWYGGQKGWFRNIGGILNAMPTRGRYITPRAGLSSIPVYGRAYPELSAYAGRQVPVQTVFPIQYSLAAGQKYATSGQVPTDYYWAWNIDSSFNPDDHTVVIGNDRYLQIQLNARTAYVKEADVVVSH